MICLDLKFISESVNMTGGLRGGVYGTHLKKKKTNPNQTDHTTNSSFLRSRSNLELKFVG